MLGALLPGYTDNPLIYFSEPLTDERLTAEGLRYGYFTGLAPVVRTLFSVRMPDGVSNERMDELLGQLKQRDFDGVYTLRAPRRKAKIRRARRRKISFFCPKTSLRRTAYPPLPVRRVSRSTCTAN